MPTSAAKEAAIVNYLGEVYTLPKIFTSEILPQSCSSSTCSSCSSCAEVETIKSVNKKLCQEISTLQEIASSLELKDQILSESHQKRYAIHRNIMMKKVKWRDYLIQQQKVEVKEEKKVIRSLQEKVVVSEALISSLKMKMDRLHHRASYWKKKSEELKELF